jgi:hypothetical protein
MRAVFVAASLVTLIGAAPSSLQETFTISGRVLTSNGAPPRDLVVMLGHDDEEGAFSGSSADLSADGTFVARRVTPGRYLVYVGPAAEPTRVRAGFESGFAVVTVRNADVASVQLRTRPSHSIHGRVRFDAADFSSAHPKINVSARVAVDGIGGGALGPQTAPVEPDGSFVIDNVVGSVVLRSGYMLPEDGSRWWSGPVLLDGRDITDVPTDFSKESSQPELVFTQRPTGVFGIVVEDATQLPAEDAAVVIFSEDPTQRQPWAQSSLFTGTDSNGRFWETLSPGRYLAVAFPAGTFRTRGEAFRDLNALAKLATSFTIVPERRGSRIRLTLSRPPIIKR